MGYLRQYSYTIADLTGRVLTRAVLELLDDGQSVRQGPVILRSIDIYHSADTAGVVLFIELTVIVLHKLRSSSRLRNSKQASN